MGAVKPLRGAQETDVELLLCQFVDLDINFLEICTVFLSHNPCHCFVFVSRAPCGRYRSTFEPLNLCARRSSVFRARRG